jgi:uncharacterized phage infection (PIP) family protein YhgE
MEKYTKEQEQELIENIGRVKEFSDKLGELTSPDSVKFWASLKRILSQVKESHEKSIMVILGERSSEPTSNTHAMCKYHAGAVKLVEYIFEIVDKNKDSQDEASARIKELKDKLKEVQDNIELQN